MITEDRSAVKIRQQSTIVKTYFYKKKTAYE